MAEAMGCEGKTQLSLRTKFIPLTYTLGKGFSTCHWSLFYLQCLNCLPASQGSLYVLLIVVSPLIDCVVVGFFNCHPERHCKLSYINISDGKKNLSGARNCSINTVGKQQGFGMLSAHLIPQLLLHLSKRLAQHTGVNGYFLQTSTDLLVQILTHLLLLTELRIQTRDQGRFFKSPNSY